MIEIFINGDPHQVEDDINLIELLNKLKLDSTKVAVERNLEIVPKTSYQNVMISGGDRLEIVHFIGGGKDGRK